MAILKVARMGHPVLRQVAQPIDPDEINGPEIAQLIADMWETMEEYGGVGLAAPQVHRSLQLAVMAMDPGASERYPGREAVPRMVLINPVITPLAKSKSGMYEGCLSLPGLRGWVERPDHIHVKALDDEVEPIEFEAKGFPAIVIQHECDHLLGKLYVDRMTDMTRLYFNEEFTRFGEADAEVDE